jgi:hypothetical protein
LFLG